MCAWSTNQQETCRGRNAIDRNPKHQIAAKAGCLMRLRALTFASAILVATGIAMLLFYAAAEIGADVGRSDGLEAFRTARAAQQTATNPGSAEPVGNESSADPAPTILASAVAEPDKRLWSASRIAKYESLGSGAADEIPEGILRIPSVDLELPVYAGTQEKNLTRGAGRIEGTPPLDGKGNTGIAAHRDGYFRVLKDVAVGDVIEIESLSGVQQFRITDLLIVKPEDVYVLDPTAERTLTLVTCYPFYFVGSAPDRFIVKGTRL
jgi:LPXTG-site transpeptidase (sortase) family protein